MKFHIIGAVALSALTVFAACKEDDKEETKKGAPLGAPEIQPPVERNLPSAIKSTALALDENAERTPKDIALDALKSKIAPAANDAVGVLQRLAQIDGQVTELDTRAQESQRACLETTVEIKDYSIGGTLPGNQNFGLKFQCQEDIDKNPDTQLAFGISDTNFYLMQRTKNAGGGIVVLANAGIDGKSVDAWQVATSSTNHDFFHITAADGSGFEATIAGSDISGQSGGHTCGLHLKSNGSLVYLKASVPYNSVCSEPTTYCVNASTFAEVAAADCVSASLDQFALTSITSSDVIAATETTNTIVAQSISGFIDFTKGIEVVPAK